MCTQLVHATQVFNYTFAAGDDAANSAEPGGVLMLAQEQDSPWGDLEEVQSLTGYIDEFRAWSTVRTAAEIKASYKVSALYPEARAAPATPATSTATSTATNQFPHRSAPPRAAPHRPAPPCVPRTIPYHIVFAVA